MKKIGFLSLLLTVALFLTSCGKTETVKTSDTPSPNVRETRLTTVVPAVEASQSVETSKEAPQKEESTDQRTEKAEKAVASIKAEDLQTVKDSIHQMHEVLNQLLTYGGIKKYVSQDDETWKVFTDPQSGLTAQFKSTVDELLPLIGDENLKLDLQTFQRFMEIATEMRLSISLAYAHRVIHDLDYWVFNSDADTDDVRDYWGATATLHGKEGNPYYYWLESKAYETHQNTNQGKK